MKFSTQACVALGAAALGLLAGAAPAPASSPLVPRSVLHRHRPFIETAQPAATEVRAGVSAVSAARSGRPADGGPLVPRAALSAAAPAPIAWTAIGPAPLDNDSGTVGGNPEPGSGRIAALAADPKDPNTFYVGAAGGGVWKTTNGGASFLALTDFLGDTAVGSVAVAPSNPKVVYAGTGEADFSGDCKYGIGLLRSLDGGASWSVIPGPQGAFVRRAISKIVVDPTNASVVYIATASAVNALPGNHGIWKSTDAGRTWLNTTAGITTTNNYTALVIDPKRPQTLYAAISRNAFNAVKGVYKTVNGGASWTKLTGGLPQSGVDRIGYTSLAIAPSDPKTLYASITSSSTDGLFGLYKTTNGGAAWTKLTAAPNYLGGQGSYDNAIVVSPTDPNTLYAAGQVNYGAQTYPELYCLVGTHDGGQTFQDYSIGAGYLGPHTDTHALAYTAGGKGLLDGNDGGVWRLENPTLKNPINQDGNTDSSNILWADLNTNLATIMFTGIALHPTDPKTVYGGSQDNGTEKTTGGLAWTQVIGGDGGFVRVDQSNPNTVYHTFYGISLQRSDDAGLTWQDAVTGINLNSPVPGGPTYQDDPSSFYIPYKLDPLNQKRVILGTDHVYESLNRGDLFTAIGIPGTNGFNPTGNIVSTLTVYGKTLYVAVGNPIGGGTGALYVTSDGGQTWADVSVPGVENLWSDVYVNPSNPKDVYVVRPLFNDFAAGKVFRSTDGGLNWNDISANLPDEPFNAVTLDKRSGTLYAGGDDGVYASTDFGGSWTQIYSALPNVQVVTLEVNNQTGILAAGTHGRGAWTLPLSKTVAQPNVAVNAALTRLPDGTVQAALTLVNTGTPNAPVGAGRADALNAFLQSVTLSGVSGTIASPAAGTVSAYAQSGPILVTFAGVPAGRAVLTTNGLYGGGRFGASLRVSVP